MRKFALSFILIACLGGQCYTINSLKELREINRLEMQKIEQALATQEKTLKEQEMVLEEQKQEIARQDKIRQTDSKSQLEYIESNVSTIKEEVQSLTNELETALSDFNKLVDTLGGGSNFK